MSVLKTTAEIFVRSVYIEVSGGLLFEFVITMKLAISGDN